MIMRAGPRHPASVTSRLPRTVDPCGYRFRRRASDARPSPLPSSNKLVGSGTAPTLAVTGVEAFGPIVNGNGLIV